MKSGALLNSCARNFVAMPQPHIESSSAAADWLVHVSVQPASIEDFAGGGGGAGKGLRQGGLSLVSSRALHEPARDVDGVAYSRDVFVATAPQTGGDDWPKMRANLEAHAGGDRRREGGEPGCRAGAEANACLDGMARVLIPRIR